MWKDGLEQEAARWVLSPPRVGAKLVGAGEGTGGDLDPCHDTPNDTVCQVGQGNNTGHASNAPFWFTRSKKKLNQNV